MWVNLTLGVSPEMAQTIEDEAEARDMSRNEYLRHLISEAESSPFEEPSDPLPSAKNSNEQTTQNGGTA